MDLVLALLFFALAWGFRNIYRKKTGETIIEIPEAAATVPLETSDYNASKFLQAGTGQQIGAFTK